MFPPINYKCLFYLQSLLVWKYTGVSKSHLLILFNTKKIVNKWNPNYENNYCQFLAILRFPLELVHCDVQTYSIQLTTKNVLLKGVKYFLEEQT